MKFSTIIKVLIFIALGICGWLLIQKHNSGGSSSQSNSHKIATALTIIRTAESDNQLSDGFNLLQQIKIESSKNPVIKQAAKKITALKNSKPAMMQLKTFQRELVANYDDIILQLEALQVKTWSRDNTTTGEMHVLQKIRSLLAVNKYQVNDFSWLQTDSKAEAEGKFITNFLQLNSFLDALLSGNENLGIKRLRSASERRDMADILEALAPINSAMEMLIKDFSALYDGLYAIEWLRDNNLQITSSNTNVGDTIKQQLFLIIALLMALLAVIYYFDRLNAVRKLKEESKYNDQAVSRLLDEIANLSEGDLTVKATVTEDFTGVLADALNFAIEQLQGLALKVNDTAEHVISISHETSAGSQQLQLRAEQQHLEMQDYCKGLDDISKGLTQIMDRVDEATQIVNSSTAVVAKSVDTLGHGQNIVKDASIQVGQARNCVARMLDYCDQIHLVLSQFQENTEKTRLTALNTSLQAAQFSNNRSLVMMTDEIINLSERVSGGSQQVKNLFDALNTEAKGSIGSLDTLIETFKQHNEAKTDMVSNAKQIVGDTEYSTDLMKGLSEKIQNHQMVAQNISVRIQTMEEGSFNSLHEITEVSRVVQELSVYALALKESIAGYKLRTSEESEVAQKATILDTDNLLSTSTSDNNNNDDDYPTIDLGNTDTPEIELFEDELDKIDSVSDEKDEVEAEAEVNTSPETPEVPEVMNPIQEPADNVFVEPRISPNNDTSIIGRIKSKIDNYPL